MSKEYWLYEDFVVTYKSGEDKTYYDGKRFNDGEMKDIAERFYKSFKEKESIIQDLRSEGYYVTLSGRFYNIENGIRFNRQDTYYELFFYRDFKLVAVYIYQLEKPTVTSQCYL